MNRKIFLLGLTGALSISFVASIIFLYRKGESQTQMAKANDVIEISGSSVQEFGSGSFYVSTLNGNKIRFDYSGVTIDGDNKLSFEEGGFILNPRTSDLHNNAISGISSLKITHGGSANDLAVDYTWGDSLESQAPYYQRRNISFSSEITYSFLSESPNYLRIKANNATTIDLIELGFTCTRGDEKGDNLQIKTANELERFKTIVNWGNSFAGQTVELANDIDLSNFSSGFTPIGTNSRPFMGTFDGKNHTISNLTIVDAASGTTKGQWRALFGQASDATIKDLKLKNVNVNASSQFNAALVGEGGGLLIENVTIESGTVAAKETVGGFVGRINNKTLATRPMYITNCVNKADIIQKTSSTYGFFGGIAGSTLGADTFPITIVGCKNYGYISATKATSGNMACAGGIIGLVRVSGTGGSFELSHCANFGNVDASTGSVGGIAGRVRTGKLNDNYSWTSSIVKKGDVVATDLIGSDATTSGRIYGINESGKATLNIYDICDEDGVSINAVAISSAAELKAARDSVNSTSSAGTFYKLVNDIELSGDFGSGFGYPTNVSFAGVFDGCGHTISGFERTADTQAGLFFSTESGVIKNIIASNVDITSSGNRAALIGRAKGALIYNCHVLSGTISSSTGEAGGIVGVSLDGTIVRDCLNNASVSSEATMVGGIVGYMFSNINTIEHCQNNGSVSSSKAYDVNGSSVGGILGGVYRKATSLIITIRNSVNNGAISSNSRGTGGIAGQIGCNSNLRAHTISYCINNGSVTSSASGSQAVGTGGIVGALGKLDTADNAMGNLTVEHCVNKGAITSGGGSLGGIAGVAFTYSDANTVKIDSCYNYGTVKSTFNSDSDGAVGVAGIVGATQPNDAARSITSIVNNVNYGSVTGSRYVGGIVGLPRKTLEGSLIVGCVNFGNVSGIRLVGGVAGQSRISIKDSGCYTGALLTNSVQSDVPAGTLDDVSKDGLILSYVVCEIQNGAVSGSFLVSHDFNHSSVVAPSIAHLVTTNENIGSFSSYAVNNISPAYSWPSLEKLNNGKYLLTSTSGYGIGDSISENAFTTWKTRDNSYGLDYARDPSGHNTDTESKSANFQPIVLPNGRVVIFYRTNSVIVDDYRYSSIRAIVSDDNCATWTKYFLFENYGEPVENGGGAYEPFPVLKGNKIYVYFACDIMSSYFKEYGNDYSAFACTRDSTGMLYQNILYFTINIDGGSFTVNNDLDFAIKATSSYRRPGMPSVVRLNDGTYAMAYEHCGSIESMNNYWMIAAISYSKDLENWTTPITIIEPGHYGQKNAGNWYLVGAPTIKLLPSGRIAVSYTTNEFYNGLEAASFTNDPEKTWFRTVELAISSNVVTYGCVPEMSRIAGIRTYEENQASCYGRCTVIDNKLILMSNNYSIAKNDKGEASRKTITGLYFSEAPLTVIYN